MSQKLTLCFGGHLFEVSMEDEYAEIFKKEAEKDFSLEKDNTIKTLLFAYMQKCLEYSKLQDNILAITDKIESL
ncbi:MAG: hypothetical protein RL154_1271 [Pseudomonadota bacterium]